jgi:DNA-binding XRE family transcriptional regulator
MKPKKMISKNKLREFRSIPDRISQWDLALKSDVKQSRISLIENCLVKPTVREKIRLAEALHKDIDIIFPKNE